MAVNDIVPFSDGSVMPGSKRYKVVAGRTGAIKVGELVLKGLAKAYATAWTPGGAASSAKPVVGTDYVLGLAMSTSTETASSTGVVDVMPIIPGVTYLGKVNTASSWDTQAEYDALVGSRVLIDYTSPTTSTGAMTILHTDGSTYGVIVEPLDISLFPNKVRFSLRQGLSYLS
jgi:hypothetical protein